MADVLSLIPDEYRQAHPTWNAVLSTTIAQVLPIIKSNPEGARRELRSALDQYLASGTPSEELRQSLKEVLR